MADGVSEQPLWRPSAERVAAANLTRFSEKVRRELDPGVDDFSSLWRWSVDRPEEFWPAVWEFCEVRAESGWDEVATGLDRMPGTRWFPGARLNFAENLLRHADDRPALVFRNEAGARNSLTYRDLGDRVVGVARGLREAGVEPGDRVAGFLPNLPEAVIAMLATSRLGAVWSSCSPDFGIQGVLDRFGQIRPKVLFSADGCRYDGRAIDCLERLRGILSRLPGIRAAVVVPYANPRPDLSAVPGAISWDEFAGRGVTSGSVPYAHLPFDHPLYVMYSSGTTGAPKCIVHSAGGTLIQHVKELALHTDLGREDRVFYFTTCGWMMWNWLVSALAVGATVVLYDGSPFHPDPGALWRMAAEERLTVFGTSAKYLSALEKSGQRPGRAQDLSALRTVLSTGSPLSPESFDFVYRDIKDDLLLASISGGTDIISCFALGNPIGPVWRGELQCRGLGMSVKVLDDDGRPVRGRKGQLCCTRPFPSMPVGFWNDPDGERYRRSYFDRFPGIWCHGDWAELTEHDGLIIHGRSDATLNPGGVRIGTAEIYRIVDALPQVVESLAVAQEWGSDVRVILFVVLRQDGALDEDLRERLRRELREKASPRHVPAKIFQIRELPRTLSGKIVELAVREVIHGREVSNRDALVNPDALDQFRDLPDLRS